MSLHGPSHRHISDRRRGPPYGVQKSSQTARNQQALEQFLLPLVIMPFGADDAIVYGQLRAQLEAQGTTIGSLDMLIASQAMRYNLVLVTNNVRELARLPRLAIEDWTKHNGRSHPASGE